MPGVLVSYENVPLNGAVNGKWKPKNENHLSDNLMHHLDDELKRRHIVVNREVEIRRLMGDRPGEKTDLMITATTKQGNSVDQAKAWTASAEQKKVDEIRSKTTKSRAFTVEGM